MSSKQTKTGTRTIKPHKTVGDHRCVVLTGPVIRMKLITDDGWWGTFMTLRSLSFSHIRVFSSYMLYLELRGLCSNLEKQPPNTHMWIWPVLLTLCQWRTVHSLFIYLFTVLSSSSSSPARLQHVSWGLSPPTPSNITSSSSMCKCLSIQKDCVPHVMFGPACGSNLFVAVSQGSASLFILLMKLITVEYLLRSHALFVSVLAVLGGGAVTHCYIRVITFLCAVFHPLIQTSEVKAHRYSWSFMLPLQIYSFCVFNVVPIAFIGPFDCHLDKMNMFQDIAVGC